MLALSRLRLLDLWLGWPAATLLGLWPRSGRPLPAAPREIVVVKLFGLGSLLVCADVFRALRAAQPQARLTVVALCGTAEAACMIPEVDEVLAIRSSGLLPLGRDGLRALGRLRRRRPDVIVDIEYFSKLSSVFCALSGARCRLGFRLPARWRERLIDGGIAFREDIHFRECVARLLTPLGVAYRQLPASADGVSAAAKAAADALLSGDGRWIAVNPHATALCVQRRWPLDRFAGVAATLLARYADLRMVVPGTAAERDASEDLRQRLPESLRSRVLVLAGRTDLPALAAVLRRCRLVLTNDTGIMHVAAAVGAPLVALFGPESPVRYGPLSAGAVVLTGDVPCGPCLSYMNRKVAPCGEEPASCMLSIGECEVLRACEKVLSANVQRPII